MRVNFDLHVPHGTPLLLPAILGKVPHASTSKTVFASLVWFCQIFVLPWVHMICPWSLFAFPFFFLLSHLPFSPMALGINNYSISIGFDVGHTGLMANSSILGRDVQHQIQLLYDTAELWQRNIFSTWEGQSVQTCLFPNWILQRSSTNHEGCEIGSNSTCQMRSICRRRSIATTPGDLGSLHGVQNFKIEIDFRARLDLNHWAGHFERFGIGF